MQVRMVKVAQQNTVRFKGCTNLPDLHFLVRNMCQDKISLRWNWLQVWLASKHVVDMISLSHNFSHIAQHIIQVFERFDRRDMTGDIDLERTLRTLHVLTDPFRKEAIANAQSR